MFHRARKSAQRVLSCKKGTAATEFALLLPILVFLFFGLLEASDAMTVNRKVAISGNTLADLTAQSTELTLTDVDNLFTGTETILDPADTSVLQMNIVSIVLNAGNPVVHWSRDNNGNTPYAAGDPYTGLVDSTVLNATSSLIVAELTYPYTSNLTHKVIGAPITFTSNAVRWPRLSSRVQLCQDAAKTNCTS